MANTTLSVYDPLFYAQEALAILTKALGLAGRVYRGYDKDPKQPGSIISIPTPTEFTAAAAPASATALNTGEVQITLDRWREVKFELTDKELTVAREQIITDHIGPAAYAIADDIDTWLATKMYQYSGWQNTASSPTDVEDVISLRKQLFTNKCPMADDKRHLMVDGTVGSELLQLSAFTQYTGAGTSGEAAQMSGFLGKRFGLNIFENQNVQAHTAGALTLGGALQLNANIAAGDTSFVLKDSTASMSGTIAAGDFFTITGSTQTYAVTALATAAANLITVSVSPAIVTAASASDAVTLTQTTASSVNLAFHENSTALAMAPLSTLGREVSGAKMETISDPISRLSLRSRIFYDGTNSKVIVALDVLYGVRVLRPNLIIRLLNA